MNDSEPTKQQEQLAAATFLAAITFCIVSLACLVAVIARLLTAGVEPALATGLEIVWAPLAGMVVVSKLKEKLKGEREPWLVLMASAGAVASFITFIVS